ncbi:MAG TPA: hypothetical protein VK335_31550 [Bryobacteraceae bacterium]|nr:hypothetical protein [Bryobacteraceae bacterium]
MSDAEHDGGRNCHAANNPPHVLEQNEQVHPVDGRGDEVEFLIEAPGFLVLSVNGERANAGNVGSLQCALHRIPQERFAHPLALPAAIHGQARQQHDRARDGGPAPW